MPVTRLSGELASNDHVKVFSLRKSVSVILISAKDNWFSVSSWEVNEGETVCIRGQYRKIVTAGPDAFKPSHELVTTDELFERNVKCPDFCFSIPSVIAGSDCRHTSYVIP